jgi:hypothetical protein
VRGANFVTLVEAKKGSWFVFCHGSGPEPGEQLFGVLFSVIFEASSQQKSICKVCGPSITKNSLFFLFTSFFVDCFIQH